MPAQAMLARKYAQAFLNVFGNSFTVDDFQNIQAAAHFFKKQPNLLFFLNWPVINTHLKLQALSKVLDSFAIAAVFNKLVELLAADKRLFLIGDVLEQIGQQYKKRKKLENFVITSAHELSAQQLATIQEFLEKLTHMKIIYEYAIDKNLIAGIRLQSDTHVWEYSVAKQLNQLELTLTR